MAPHRSTRQNPSRASSCPCSDQPMALSARACFAGAAAKAPTQSAARRNRRRMWCLGQSACGLRRRRRRQKLLVLEGARHRRHAPERGTQAGELLLHTRSGPATGTCSEDDDGDDASTRLQLDEVGRERQVQQQGRQRQRAEALAGTGRWRSRRRWFPWRVRSRVGVAEGVWREVCVCVCEFQNRTTQNSGAQAGASPGGGAYMTTGKRPVSGAPLRR